MGRTRRAQSLWAALCLMCALLTARGQGTAFTYQGRLDDGATPVNGLYDLEFSLFATNSGGGVVAGPVTNSGVSIVGGIFTQSLDFGGGVFTGASLWLEVAVRTNGATAFTILSPRQSVAPSPYALYAPNAGLALSAASANAVASGGTVPLSALPGAVITNGATGVQINGSFSGDGSGLVNLPIRVTNVYSVYGISAVIPVETPAGLVISNYVNTNYAWTDGAASNFGYYVDSANGNDANPGISPGFAFKSLGALTNADAAHHLPVWNFARGSSWRQQLTVRSNNMILQSYGSPVSAAPLFDASDVISNEWFEETAETSNVYEATVPISNLPDAGQCVNVYENGTNLMRASSLEGCDAAAGTYYITGDNQFPSPAITIWLHPNGSTVPLSDGKLYEYTSRQSGVFSYGGNNTYIGLWTRRNLLNDGSIRSGSNTVYLKCLASDGGKHNMYAEGGSAWYNCVCSNAYAPLEGATNSLAPFCAYSLYGGNIAFSNCSALTTINYGSTWLATGGYYAHTDGLVDFGTVAYTNCSSIGFAESFQAANTSNLCVYACSADGSISMGAVNNDVTATTIVTTNSGGAVTDESAGVVQTISLRNDVLKAIENHAECVFVGNNYELTSFSATNSVISATNNGFAIWVPSGNLLSNFASFSNNISATWNWYNVAQMPELNAASAYHSDSNIFTQVGNHCEIGLGGTNYGDGAPYTFSQYTNATGQDAHSSHP